MRRHRIASKNAFVILINKFELIISPDQRGGGGGGSDQSKGIEKIEVNKVINNLPQKIICNFGNKITHNSRLVKYATI